MDEFRYKIPAGTTVDIRNIAKGEKVRQHITRKDLYFKDRSGTGIGGLIFYFLHGDWEIGVNADRVE